MAKMFSILWEDSDGNKWSGTSFEGDADETEGRIHVSGGKVLKRRGIGD